MTNEEATIDIEATAGRLQAILHPETGKGITAVSSQAPAQPNRKPRSDKGVPKKPPADPDEITLRFPLDEALELSKMLLPVEPDIANHIQRQIIAHLQKRIDALTRAK